MLSFLVEGVEPVQLLEGDRRWVSSAGASRLVKYSPRRWVTSGGTSRLVHTLD